MELFDFLKGSNSKSAGAEPQLIFKDGSAAFEYACKFLECPLHEGSFLLCGFTSIGKASDVRQLFGTAF